MSCPGWAPAQQHTTQTPPASAATPWAGTDSDAVTRVVRGSIRNSRPPVVVAQTAPAPTVTWTTGGSTVSMSGTTTLRPVTGSTRSTSPPAATQTDPGVTAMASTWAAVAAVFVMPGEPGGRVAVTTGWLVRTGDVGGRRVEDPTGVSRSSRGCSNRPAASRPTRAMTVTTAADNQRWGRAKALHLQEHLALRTEQMRDQGDMASAADILS